MCDGIFLNYGWKEEGLIETVKECGRRKTDVYVGVDVFGRGVFGGGGFTTCQVNITFSVITSNAKIGN